MERPLFEVLVTIQYPPIIYMMSSTRTVQWPYTPSGSVTGPISALGGEMVMRVVVLVPKIKEDPESVNVFIIPPERER